MLDYINWDKVTLLSDNDLKNIEIELNRFLYVDYENTKRNKRK